MGEVFVTNGNDPGTVTVVPVSSGTSSTASPTASASSSPTSTPKIPEFSSTALVLVLAAMAAATLCAVALSVKKPKRIC